MFAETPVGARVLAGIAESAIGKQVLVKFLGELGAQAKPAESLGARLLFDPPMSKAMLGLMPMDTRAAAEIEMNELRVFARTKVTPSIASSLSERSSLVTALQELDSGKIAIDTPFTSAARNAAETGISGTLSRSDSEREVQAILDRLPRRGALWSGLDTPPLTTSNVDAIIARLAARTAQAGQRMSKFPLVPRVSAVSEVEALGFASESKEPFTSALLETALEPKVSLGESDPLLKILPDGTAPSSAPGTALAARCTSGFGCFMKEAAEHGAKHATGAVLGTPIVLTAEDVCKHYYCQVWLSTHVEMVADPFIHELAHSVAPLPMEVQFPSTLLRALPSDPAFLRASAMPSAH